MPIPRPMHDTVAKAFPQGISDREKSVCRRTVLHEPTIPETDTVSSSNRRNYVLL